MILTIVLTPLFQLLRLKKPKKRLKLKKQEKPKRLDRLKNKLQPNKLQPKKLHAKHKNRQRLNRYNNKLLVDTLEMLVADGIVQMDNTLQKLKLLQQVFLGKQSNLNNFTKVVRKSL